MIKLLSLNLRILAISALLLLSFAFVSTTALAKNDGGTRPGWGFGDQNHVHTGPPGHSVHPVLSVNQTNNSSNSFSIAPAINTGNNTFSGNAPVNLVTGAAEVVISFVANMGQNIFGS